VLVLIVVSVLVLIVVSVLVLIVVSVLVLVGVTDYLHLLTSSTPDKLRRSNGFAFAPRRASQVSLEEEVPFSILMEQAEQTGDADTLFPPHSPDVSVSTITNY